MNDIIEILQDWYTSQCNDTWEHSYGIKITTLDNPGWLVEIDGVSSKKIINRELTERSKIDWIDLQASETRFKGAGGLKNLKELLENAIKWLNQA